jgi:DNA polymerase III sliding clamp (beta) subunit (PCNA family)
MLKELKFVQGAVAKKDFMPAMTHFAITVDDKGGFVRAYNGVLALGSPLAFDIPCTPKASQLVPAIANAPGTITLSMTDAKRLRVAGEKGYRRFVDCVEETSAHAEPEGERVEFDGQVVLNVLKKVEPFIGNDASRAWSNGVLLSGSSAYATNNVTLIQCWLTNGERPVTLPFVVNLPRAAVLEMLRLNEAPTHAQMTTNSMTFHYSGRRWLRTQLLETKWPDMDRIFGDHTPSRAKPLDPALFDALERLESSGDKMGRVFVEGDRVFTKDDQQVERGSMDVPGLGMHGIYQISMLKLLQGTATHADLGTYPAPCIFYGDMLRGAIIGMRP